MTRTTPDAFRVAADAWYHRIQEWRRAWAEWEGCELGTPEERAAWRRQRAARDALALARRVMDAAAQGGGAL